MFFNSLRHQLSTFLQEFFVISPCHFENLIRNAICFHIMVQFINGSDSNLHQFPAAALLAEFQRNIQLGPLVSLAATILRNLPAIYAKKRGTSPFKPVRLHVLFWITCPIWQTIGRFLEARIPLHCFRIVGPMVFEIEC